MSHTSSDLGLSTKTLKGFLNAAPETVQKHPERFGRALSINPRAVAKEKGQRLVPKLSGKRLRHAWQVRNTPEYVSSKGRLVKVDVDWTNRSINYARVTRTYYAEIHDGKRVYVPIKSERREDIYGRRQIMSGLAGENTRSFVNKWKVGKLTRGEALRLITDLWKNSDVAFTPEMEAKYFGSEE
jgi:hypothetical protein